MPGTDRGEPYRGLSPPVRGSPPCHADRLAPRGSIPARAGEPRVAFKNDHGNRVYPRPCGGARQSSSVVEGVSGLSPPVRGSPRKVVVHPTDHGSIPARAGEPS